MKKSIATGATAFTFQSLDMSKNQSPKTSLMGAKTGKFRRNSQIPCLSQRLCGSAKGNFGKDSFLSPVFPGKK